MPRMRAAARAQRASAARASPFVPALTTLDAPGPSSHVAPRMRRGRSRRRSTPNDVPARRRIGGAGATTASTARRRAAFRGAASRGRRRWEATALRTLVPVQQHLSGRRDRGSRIEISRGTAAHGLRTRRRGGASKRWSAQSRSGTGQEFDVVRPARLAAKCRPAGHRRGDCSTVRCRLFVEEGRAPYREIGTAGCAELCASMVLGTA